MRWTAIAASAWRSADAGGRRVPRTRLPASSTQRTKVWQAGRCLYGPLCSAMSWRSVRSTSFRSERRRPSRRYAAIVSPITTSGCENSDAFDGTSLPTKGTARCLRFFGMHGLAASARASSSGWSSP